MEHAIADDTLDRFVHSQASQPEKRAVIAHLLQGCQLCADRLRGRAWSGTSARDYTAVLDRFEMNFLASLEPLDETSADRSRRASLPGGENPEDPWSVSREDPWERKGPRSRNPLR